MSNNNGFVKHNKCHKADWLQENYPNAFLLLALIARRAAWNDDNLDGFKQGECHIGDHVKAGLTRKQYRTALKFLTDHKFVQIIQTCRSRKGGATEGPPNAKKSATETATVGTKVKLLDSDVWDLNIYEEGHRNGHRSFSKVQKKGHEEEYKKDISNDISNIAQTPAVLRKKNEFCFSFESKKFENITEVDLKDWKDAYPEINIQQELAKAKDWLLSNPARANKKLWRKFITGWFSRANDKLFNQKAYQSQTQSSKVEKLVDNKAKILNKFKHGEIYNGAECFITEDCIAFQRHMTHHQVKFKEFGFEDQFANMLRKFQIN